MRLAMVRAREFVMAARIDLFTYGAGEIGFFADRDVADLATFA